MPLVVIILAGMISCKTEKPNIILILTSQQTINAMSISGNPYLKTPNMDRLASRGVLFMHAYCTAPAAGPSRASIVTGLMPSENGVIYSGDDLLPGIKTAGEIFREDGYKTVWAGKWLLPENTNQRGDANLVDFVIPGYDLLTGSDAVQSTGMPGSEEDPAITKAVSEFIRSYKKELPLFLTVSYQNPHDISFLPGKTLLARGNDSIAEISRFMITDPANTNSDQMRNTPPLPANFLASPGEPGFITEKRLDQDIYGAETGLAMGFSDREWQSYLNSYYRLTELVDIEIGKLLDVLEETGYDNNTLIIFTSDHGDGATAHQWAGKLSLYEESSKVPFIVSYPPLIKQGMTDDVNLISLADIVPTICDYAGIKTNSGFAGRSMRPLFEKKNPAWREYLVAELADSPADRTRTGRMVRTSGFKYNVYSAGSNNEQLFDFSIDKNELLNLAYSPDFKVQVEMHRRLLKEWDKTRRKYLITK